jgi:glyoxylase-like metal-dependent hydrolase (beta-lactamase superfamily II)
MTSITVFTCNPFSENGYIVSNEQKECWIIDPGCYTDKEKTALQSYIEKKELTPIRLLNTHCHLDHVFGNSFVANTYGLAPEFHKLEIPVLENAAIGARMFGVKPPEYVAPKSYIEEGDILKFGEHSFQVLFTPGHSPGSICFYNEAEQYVIAGDVLFQGSIGRTDLPGGDYDTLIHSIKSKLLSLPDAVTVYNGHGAYTTIGEERRKNPFLR